MYPIFPGMSFFFARVCRSPDQTFPFRPKWCRLYLMNDLEAATLSTYAISLLCQPTFPPRFDIFCFHCLAFRTVSLIRACIISLFFSVTYRWNLFIFLDESSHLYMRVCPSVGRSVTSFLSSVNLTRNHCVIHPKGSRRPSMLSTTYRVWKLQYGGFWGWFGVF